MARVPVLTSDELRAVEARAAGRFPSLMERAGKAVAALARRMADDTGAPILVVAGPGNNGGDAWVAASHLQEGFSRVVVFDATGAPPKAEEARAAKARFAERGGQVVREWPATLHAAMVIDGLLGLGLARDVDGPFTYIISRINGSKLPVLAIDVPSGLDSATGVVRGAAVRAATTLTFIAHKVGLHTADGPDQCGTVELEELGTGEEVRGAARGQLLSPSSVRAWLAPRKRNSHKGDFGALGIVGGNRGMVGAALLAGRAALLSGAGKVYLGLLAADAPSVDQAHPELMLRPVDDALSADVLVVGPGAGLSPSSTSISQFERSVLPAALAARKPLVLDADGLNAVALNDALQKELAARKAPTILTPHPAEAGRLLKRDTAAVQSERLAAALALAEKFKANVVLKGTGSICAFPDGRWSINATGNPGLASGGTGDVLAGIIGALLAQGLAAERALQYGVCLHGAAADALVARGKGPIGLTASEVSSEALHLLNVWTSR